MIKGRPALDFVLGKLRLDNSKEVATLNTRVDALETAVGIIGEGAALAQGAFMLGRWTPVPQQSLLFARWTPITAS